MLGLGQIMADEQEEKDEKKSWTDGWDEICHPKSWADLWFNPILWVIIIIIAAAIFGDSSDKDEQRNLSHRSDGPPDKEVIDSARRYFSRTLEENMPALWAKIGRNPRDIRNFEWVEQDPDGDGVKHVRFYKIDNNYKRKNSRGETVWVTDVLVTGRIRYDLVKPEGVYEKEEEFTSAVLSGWEKRGEKFYQVMEWTPYP